MIGLGDLIENPNKVFKIEDHEEAQLLLLSLGLSGRFSQSPSKEPSTTQVLTHGNYPTHFIVAMLFLGKTKASDNGYLIYCLPKSQYPPDKAMEFVRQISESLGKVEILKSFPGEFDSN